MKIAVFVTIWSAGIQPPDLSRHMQGAPLDFLRAAAGVETVEIYIPETGDVPKMDDIPAPTVIVQIDLASEAGANVLTASEDFKRLFLNKDGFPAPLEKINLEVFEPVHYPLPGQARPPARTAPMSFVVRYYGPVRDQFEFVDFYTKHHPPLLAKFPNIRNVLCYLPLGWKTRGQIDDNSIVIGNEVVFDDVDTFQAALASEVMKEVMADSEHFSPYGYSAHHAMRRTLVYSRNQH